MSLTIPALPSQLSPQQVTYVYIHTFFDTLVELGIEHICLCPGSRSTPLAVLAVRHPRLRVWTHLDERSAAFFALGIGKVTGKPAAVIATSGTAVANFLPAVVEARYAQVPLLVLSADRPPELQESGAPQTIDQQRLYGSQTRWFMNMALPDASAEMLTYVRATATRAVAHCVTPVGAPVHLNFPFREPLMPLSPPASWSSRNQSTERSSLADPIRLAMGQSVPHDTILDELATRLLSTARGWIVCGPQTDPRLAQPLHALASHLGYPLYADVLSNTRHSLETESNRSPVIAAYDGFLRTPHVASWPQPDLILRIGDAPVSKSLTQYLESCKDAAQIIISASAAWSDPIHTATQVVMGNPTAVVQALLRRLPAISRAGDPWLLFWRQIDRTTRQAIDIALAASASFFEGRVAAELAHAIPQKSIIFAGNSMPVRDLDTFFMQPGPQQRILANRGANGIDGVVSSALGVAAATSDPVVLVIGDISFYHDSNGLLAAKRYPLNATIILVNNDGGGIFSFLPQAAYPDVFEECFGTPHGLEFGPLVELYGGRYHLPLTWTEFRTAVKAATETGGLDVIEVRTDRPENVTQHRAVWQAVAAALTDAALPGMADIS